MFLLNLIVNSRDLKKNVLKRDVLTCIMLGASLLFSLSCTGFQEEAKYEIKEFFDLPYYQGADADSIKHKLNLFVPQGVQNPPLLLWIHGGAWAFGGRKFESNLARKFAREGVAVAAISYRLSPGTWRNPKFKEGIQHPEHIKDVARAFAWVHDNGRTYGYDTHSIFVSGYSAGGHLAALLSMDPTYLHAVGKSVRDVRGAIPIAGAYDISAYHQSHLKYNGREMAEKHVQAVFGNTEASFRNASPTSFVNNQWVPMLVISERETYDYTRLLENAAKQAEYHHMQFHHISNEDHESLLDNLAKSDQSPYRKMILDYIWEHRVPYKTLQANGVQLAYRVFGTGEPLFVLNGGPGFSSHNFQGLAQRFSKTHQVVIFDQRGTGFSELNSETISMKAMVEDLEALRKHLGYDQISLFGQSFGGMYAMCYAKAYPNCVKSMILSHSGGMDLQFLDETNERLMRGLAPEDHESLREVSSIKNPELRMLERHRALAAGYVFDKNLRNRVFKGLAFKSRFYPEVNEQVWSDLRKNGYNVFKAMQQFANPVLILHGDHDVVHPKYATLAHQTFPNSKLTILKNCVHYGWLDAPKNYFATIENFLRSP
ncbi:alpha/beta hydrolase [Flagellimonas myxillae]|uniref:alpha/beta hydrolase n=1 Tax=Flagellimonas myxillae TaxID=2942214 RepID=UPI00201F5580|nr:alpha/beta hydrolase [Muricauda myxillae]MCL6265105.1 alpha/beta hydrolase [Muricauda myxillae]